MKIPSLEPKQRLLGVDRAAEALARFIVDGGTLPDPALLEIPGFRQRLKPEGDLQNIRHTGLALGVLLRHSGAAKWAADFYELDLAGHRRGFEAFAVGYSNFQVLAALAIWFCEWAPADLRESARQFLRRDIALSCLCATREGVVALPCGRMYASPEGGLATPHKGVGSAAHDYRVRDVLGFPQPKPRDGGISAQQWRRHSWLSAWPWRAIEGLSARLFTDAERVALCAWVEAADKPPAIAASIRIAEGLTVFRSPAGHVACCDHLDSFGGGRNRCLPLVIWRQEWAHPARGKEPWDSGVRAVVARSPATVERTDQWMWVVRSGRQEIWSEIEPLAGAVELRLTG